jgi:hypothetical protein
MMAMQKIGKETDVLVHKQSGAQTALGVDVAGTMPLLPAIQTTRSKVTGGQWSCPTYRGIASAPFAG